MIGFDSAQTKAALGRLFIAGATQTQCRDLKMDNRDIEDMFSALGPVVIRRMFGGKGIYFQGRILAIEVRDVMLLKADSESGPEFEAAGAKQWIYEKHRGSPVKMPYWSVPDDAFDDPDIMAGWVRLAFEAASRGLSRTRSKQRA